ncbi:MAG: hypothetical protein ABJB01_10455 [Rudaea sp.]
MRILFGLLCVFLAGQAVAADVVPPASPDPAANPGKKFAPRSVLAPTISETRVTRMPDGSLVISCNDRPNPKATASIQRARSPHVAVDQQP